MADDFCLSSEVHPLCRGGSVLGFVGPNSLSVFLQKCVFVAGFPALVTFFLLLSLSALLFLFSAKANRKILQKIKSLVELQFQKFTGLFPIQRCLGKFD